MPAGSDVADALEAVAVAARASVLRFGRPEPVWQIVSRLSAGGVVVTQHEFPRDRSVVS